MFGSWPCLQHRWRNTSCLPWIWFWLLPHQWLGCHCLQTHRIWFSDKSNDSRFGCSSGKIFKFYFLCNKLTLILIITFSNFNAVMKLTLFVFVSFFPRRVMAQHSYFKTGQTFSLSLCTAKITSHLENKRVI